MHVKEENCEIKNQVGNGNISKERYERYVKILKELQEKEEHKKW